MKKIYYGKAVYNNKEINAVLKVLRQQELQLIDGKNVKKLEKNVCKLFGKKYGLMVNSGSSANLLALASLNLKKGSEIITPNLTFSTTVAPIYQLGLTPHFVGVEENKFITDPSQIEKCINKKTVAIMIPNLLGNIANWKKIHAIAKKYKLKVIEDSAQSFGSRRYNMPSGSFGDISCFSFNPMKVLPSLGEAGAIVTNKKKIYEKIKTLRYAGTIFKENCVYPSLNFKIDTIQATFIIEYLKNLKKLIKRRISIAEIYNKGLDKSIIKPEVENGYVDTFYTYTIQVNNRNQLLKYLNSKGIEARVKHPILVSDQIAYKKYKKANLSNANKIIKKIISLPINDKMTNEEVRYVIQMVNRFYK